MLREYQVPNYLDPRTLAKLQGLQLRAGQLVAGYVAGMHRSPRRGFSIEFAEHREYAPGDDLRYLDWKVFGRTDKHYLKQYEDETNLVCYLVVDVSESMQYRGSRAPWSKFDHAATAAGALAWLVLQQQDAVGLVTFDEQVRDFISPASNPLQLKQILHVLELASHRGKTQLSRTLHELADRLTSRGVVILFSDFFDDVPAMLSGLTHLRHRRHEVIAFHTLDADELEFPFHRPTMFRGLESLPQAMVEPRSLRQSYLKHFQRYREMFMEACRGQQIDYQLLDTGQSLAIALSTFLAHRRVRLR